MHFSRMGSYEDHEVPVIVRGEGAYVWDQHGKRYLDGLAGLFTSQIGHGRTELAEAGAKQAETLAYFPLWTYAHPRAIELAERVASLAPGDLNRVFFTTGGSEAVESAWKLARQYFRITGQPQRTKVISRYIAYHGTSLGALSITGHPRLRIPFEPLVPGAIKVPNTNFYRADIYADDEVAFGRWAADEIERAILQEGPDSVAAVFLEPVQNAGGCFPPPPGYFERVREICDRHGVLLVSDEVICAFGRLGEWFGVAALRVPARHHHGGQGPDLGLRAAGGHDRLRPPHGALPRARRLLPARIHLRRPPGELRRGHGQPRRLRGRAHPPARAIDRGRVPQRARESLRPADRGQRARCRVLLRDRAREGQGDPSLLRRRGVGAPPARLPLRCALRRRPDLPGRRPRRPRRAALPAPHLRAGRRSTSWLRRCARCSARRGGGCNRARSRQQSRGRGRAVGVGISAAVLVVGGRPGARCRRAPRSPRTSTSTSASSAAASPACGRLASLALADPTLRVAVLEREVAGFGASGRNGGWCSALFATSDAALARRHGPDAMRAMRRAMQDTVDEVGAARPPRASTAISPRAGRSTWCAARPRRPGPGPRSKRPGRSVSATTTCAGSTRTRRPRWSARTASSAPPTHRTARRSSRRSWRGAWPTRSSGAAYASTSTPRSPTSSRRPGGRRSHPRRDGAGRRRGAGDRGLDGRRCPG